MQRVVTRVFALFILIAFAIPAHAQLGSIFGTVVDLDGKPVVGATVSIDRDEVKYHVEVKTDKNGLYSKLGVEDGNYRITITQNNKTIASGIATVSLGFRVDRNFDMRNPASSQAPAGGAALSKAQQEAEQKANSATQGAFNAGVAALNARNYDEAIKQFSLAAQRQPKMPVIFARLAETYAGAKKNTEAIDAYKKAIDLKSDEPDYHYQLGLLLVNSPSTMADAAAQFDKYLQLAPKGENAATAKQLSDAAKASK
jgi:tetratricopeptide (TPR) repeat protein